MRSRLNKLDKDNSFRMSRLECNLKSVRNSAAQRISSRAAIEELTCRLGELGHFLWSGVRKLLSVTARASNEPKRFVSLDLPGSRDG